MINDFAGSNPPSRKIAPVIASITSLVTDAIRQGSPKNCPCAVFLASDASQNTQKRIENCCKYYKIPLYRTTLTTDSMGEAIGKSGAISAVGIKDAGLADALVNLL